MTQVKEFSKRLDKIFNDGEPTKALIIDAYIKTNPTAQTEALNIDDVSNQRELLIAFFNNLYDVKTKEGKEATEKKIDCYLSNL